MVREFKYSAIIDGGDFFIKYLADSLENACLRMHLFLTGYDIDKISDWKLSVWDRNKSVFEDVYDVFSNVNEVMIRAAIEADNFRPPHMKVFSKVQEDLTLVGLSSMGSAVTALFNRDVAETELDIMAHLITERFA